MLAWYAPELQIDAAALPIGSYWPCGADYNKYYHNYFNSMNSMVSYAVSNRARIARQTTEWQIPRFLRVAFLTGISLSLLIVDMSFTPIWCLLKEVMLWLMKEPWAALPEQWISV